MVETGESVCWLLPDLSHYHHARVMGYVRAGHKKMTVIQLTEVSGFREFAHVGRVDGYQLITLFPARVHQNISKESLFRTLQSTLDQIRPAAVIIPGWSDPLAYAALDWAIRHRASKILLSESQKIDQPRSAIKEWIKRRLIRLYDSALCGGSRHADYLAELGMPRNRISLGYDAVDHAHFAAGADAARSNPALRKELALPERYLLASARFIPKKNLSGLLAGYKHYRSALGNQAWDLVLLGDGELRPQLEIQSRELDLSHCVQMPGYRGYNVLPSYYGLAEAFVHASLTEQWGLVINEAAAAGLPVIVSNRCGAAPDLVRDGETGYLFDPANSEELGRKLVELHNRSDRREMGLVGRGLAEEWGPSRFGQGLATAIDNATPLSHSNALSRAVLRVLRIRSGTVTVGA